MNNKKNRVKSARAVHQKGAIFLEALIVLPVAISAYFGGVIMNAALQADRILERAVGEAMLINGLRPTPLTTAAGSQRKFTVTYRRAIGVSELDTTKADWVTGQFQHPAVDAIPEAARNCAAGESDITCAAWATMLVIGRTIHSSQGGSVLAQVDITVEYDDRKVDGDPNLGKFGKARVTASSTVAGGLLAYAGRLMTVSRSEVIG